jgi:phage terminase small subunit
VADKLTIKQEKFAQGLFAGLSQREAYKQAFNCSRMKDATIDVKACELAKKDKVRVRLQKLQNEFKERNFVSVERTLQEYARLGYYDPRKFFNEDGSPKPIQDLDDDTAAVLAGFEVMEVWEGHGENREFVGYLKKIKLPDKRAALDSIARHLGMFVEKSEVEIKSLPQIIIKRGGNGE